MIEKVVITNTLPLPSEKRIDKIEVLSIAPLVANAISAVDLVRHGGDILFFGYPRGQVIPFNFELLFHKCCRARTIVGATVERISADQVDDAWDRAVAGDVRFRFVIDTSTINPG